jgi:hypothetical protein
MVPIKLNWVPYGYRRKIALPCPLQTTPHAPPSRAIAASLLAPRWQWIALLALSQHCSCPALTLGGLFTLGLFWKVYMLTFKGELARGLDSAVYRKVRHRL